MQCEQRCKHKRGVCFVASTAVTVFPVSIAVPPSVSMALNLSAAHSETIMLAFGVPTCASGGNGARDEVVSSENRVAITVICL